MSAVFPVLKANYRWIILDTAATFSELNLSAFDQSDLVVVVTAPDLVSLKTTQACLDVFSALQTTGERRLLLLNQIYPRARLEPGDMEKSSGGAHRPGRAVWRGSAAVHRPRHAAGAQPARAPRRARDR